MIEKRKCLGCSKEFEVHNHNQRYCSPFCYPSTHQSAARNCAICGKEFFSHGKFCSLKCYLIYAERKKAEQRKEAKMRREKLAKGICYWCREQYTITNYITQIYCSDFCGREYRKMIKHIGKLFEQPREQAELAKLKQLGKGYQLPERDSE